MVVSEHYQIGNVAIALTPGHPLPGHQSKHPLYDRLPIVMGLQSFTGWIIDIGANVGDSAAAFVSGSPKKILCIEPYAAYARILEQNRAALEANGSQIQIAPFAVSCKVGYLQVSADSGTARATSEGHSASLPTLTLDQLIARYCPDQTIDLIKCDVDGYDADALLSGMGTIGHWKPIIYFECDLTAEQIGNYVELYEQLSILGYVFKCFDNFGLPLQTIADANTFREILTYICLMGEEKSSRSFYYIDCMAYVIGNEDAATILSNYSNYVRGLRFADEA